MPIKQGPTVQGTTQLIGGKATCVFPSRPYPRVVITVDVQNSVPGGFTIYRGSVSGAFTRIAGSSQGSNQQYTQPFRLPSGQQLFVQWNATPTPLSDAQGRMTWLEIGK